MAWVPLKGGGADLAQQWLVLGADRVRLTTKERDLLAYLAANPGRTITRRELLVKVWGHPESASEEPVFSTVKRLRAKIDREGHRHVVSVHGDGYRFEAAPETGSSFAAELPGKPVPSADFVGRRQELEAIDVALARPGALVTLAGPGGAGKTRCALEVAARRESAFCDLSGAVDEVGMISSLASALGVPLDGATPDEWITGVGRALAAAPSRLLVLDNVEQNVPAAAAILERWRIGRPTILCTTREPLMLSDEVVISIGPLSSHEAVALLEQRLGALAPEPDRALHEAIVARVDFLPLAIELAAAQARELGARALLSSLDDQLATLSAGRRAGPARHASLRATVEWSWTLLPERERETLSELSVFVGPFDLAAARAVTSRPDVAALLASLCRRSLVARAGDRFSLFAAVRELGAERATDLADARTRHAAYFASEGEAAASLLDGPDHRAAVARLEAAKREIAVAHDASTVPVLRARLALLLDRALGLQVERASSRRAILERARAHIDQPSLELALLLAESRLEGAPPELLDRALLLAVEPVERAEVLLTKAERLAASDPRAALLDLDAAWTLAARASARLKGRIKARLGETLFHLGRVEQASQALQVALALHGEAEDRRFTARTSALLAHVVRLETGGGTARALLASAQAAADELGDPLVRARVLLDLGQHLTRVADQTGARAALEEAAQVYERLGFARDRAMLHLHVAEALVGMGDFEGALREALTTWAALVDDIARSTVCEAIACVHLLRHDLTEGERWLEQGLKVARERGAARSECTLLGKRGLLHLVRGDLERAWHDFDDAVQKNEERGSPALAGASLADRALAGFALGREESARADLARARQMLHDPSERQLEGRLLAACEPLGRAFAAVRTGELPAKASAAARARLEQVFAKPPHEWDVVLRLIDWLLSSIDRYPAGTQR